MQTKQSPFASIAKLSLCAVLALGALQLRAEDKKADPTGTWSWTMPGRNGGPDRTNTLKLKVEGEKLSGTLSSPGRQGQVNETAIQEGTFKTNEVAFTVSREFNGNKMVIKYDGKLAGDTIKGKSEFERDGSTQSRDWEATRQTEKK